MTENTDMQSTVLPTSHVFAPIPPCDPAKAKHPTEIDYLRTRAQNAEAEIERLRARIAELEARLEIDHVFVGPDMVREEVPPSERDAMIDGWRITYEGGDFLACREADKRRGFWTAWNS